MKIDHILHTYDETSDLKVEYGLDIEVDGIVFSLKDDHVLNDDSTNTPAFYGRSVKIELRADGTIGVLLFATNKDEPVYVKLDNSGDIEVMK